MLVFKIMAFLSRRPGISRDEFVEHYEHHHVPFVLGLAPPPLAYRRNYVVEPTGTGTALAADRAAPPDVITELTFVDRAAYESWIAVVYAPGSGTVADEERFLDRSRTTSVAVDERVTRS